MTESARQRESWMSGARNRASETPTDERPAKDDGCGGCNRNRAGMLELAADGAEGARPVAPPRTGFPAPHLGSVETPTRAALAPRFAHDFSAVRASARVVPSRVDESQSGDSWRRESNDA